MGTVTDIRDFKRKKEKERESPVVQEIKASLDNDTVKRRYGINKKETEVPPTYEERYASIRRSIERVNKLMFELNENTTKQPTKDKTP